jgi:hypothetical protein
MSFKFEPFCIIFSAVILKSDPRISPLLLEPGAFLARGYLEFIGEYPATPASLVLTPLISTCLFPPEFLTVYDIFAATF